MGADGHRRVGVLSRLLELTGSMPSISPHPCAGEDDNPFVARVIAALVMVFVFGSFRLNGDPPVRQFGVGLTVAVILEVTAAR
jgi:hypothetical protein